MTPSQRYQDKAAEAERLVRDPRHASKLRSELRAIARHWRHRAELADWTARQLRAPNATAL